MELYFNETLIGLCPEEDDLWAAFEELREEVLGYLLLRRGPGSAMSVLKAPGVGYCVTAEHGEGLFGIIFPEEQADAAIEALAEFLRGSLPRVFSPWSRAPEAGPGRACPPVPSPARQPGGGRTPAA